MRAKTTHDTAVGASSRKRNAICVRGPCTGQNRPRHAAEIADYVATRGQGGVSLNILDFKKQYNSAAPIGLHTHNTQQTHSRPSVAPVNTAHFGPAFDAAKRGAERVDRRHEPQHRVGDAHAVQTQHALLVEIA